MNLEETSLIEDGLKAIAKMTQKEFEGLKVILRALIAKQALKRANEST